MDGAIENLYALADCHLEAADDEDDIDRLIEPYLEQIHKGEDISSIIPEIYEHTSRTLLDAFERGCEKELFGADWTIKDNVLLNRVQNNLFAFSGAKSYAEVIALRNQVYDKGKLQDWNTYKRAALKINSRYNKTYLSVEREMVMSSGTQGSRWIDIEEGKEEYPYLEYVTKKDEHVREDHKPMDGIILSVDDPFWSAYYPPNGWRCRCSTRKLSEREYRHKSSKEGLLTSDEAQRIAGKHVAKPFRHNVGTSEIIDREQHPYFKANAAAKELQLSAVKNYGMKPVKTIYETGDDLAAYRGTIHSEEEYRKHWEHLEQKYNKGVLNEGFTLVDRKRSIAAHFDRSLMEKMIDRNRCSFFDEVEALMDDPDEVWGGYKKSKPGSRFKEEFFNVYIRYYDDTPIVLLINTEGRVDSFYKWGSDISDFESWRKGVLKYRKR